MLYWKAYGGLKSVIKSIYFRASLIITAIIYPVWTNDGWWDDPISIIPNLLGFTLGGLAMFLAFSDKGFVSVLSFSAQQEEDKGGKKYSIFIRGISTFVHFVIVQVLTLLYAFVFKSFYGTKYWTFPNCMTCTTSFTTFQIFINCLLLMLCFVGYLGLIYSICLIAATAFNLLTISKWHAEFIKSTNNRHLS